MKADLECCALAPPGIDLYGLRPPRNSSPAARLVPTPAASREHPSRQAHDSLRHSYDDFCIVRDNLKGGSRTTRDRLVPFCIFTDPEVARVGLNESEARARGIEYRVARMPADSVLRARTLSETRGFLKMLIDRHSSRILGFTGFVTGAGDVMAVVQTAMLTGAPFPLLRDAILTHPTMAEGLGRLLADVEATPGEG